MRRRFRRHRKARPSLDAQDAGAPKRGVIDRIHAGERSGVRRRGLGRRLVPSGLYRDHRFQPRRRARGRHEFSRVGYGLDVEQDGLRCRIVGEIVQHVAEIDVGHVAERHKMREADAAADAQSSTVVTMAPD